MNYGYRWEVICVKWDPIHLHDLNFYLDPSDGSEPFEPFSTMRDSNGSSYIFLRRQVWK